MLLLLSPVIAMLPRRRGGTPSTHVSSLILSMNIFLLLTTSLVFAAPTAKDADGYGDTKLRDHHTLQVAECRRRGNLFAYYSPLDKCMPLLDDRSPCSEPAAVLVLNATTLEATCMALPCPLSHVLLPDGRCHAKNTVCSGRDDMELVLRETGYGACDCHDRHVYWAQTDRCYEAFTRGPCARAEYIVFRENSGVKCEPTPCPAEQVPWQGQCVERQGHGCIDSVHGHLLLNPASLRFQCTLRCPDGMVEVGLDCYRLYSRGPCSYGELVEPVLGTRYGRCVPNPCEEDGLLPWDGRCWRDGDYCNEEDDGEEEEDASASAGAIPDSVHLNVFGLLELASGIEPGSEGGVTKPTLIITGGGGSGSQRRTLLPDPSMFSGTTKATDSRLMAVGPTIGSATLLSLEAPFKQSTVVARHVAGAGAPQTDLSTPRPFSGGMYASDPAVPTKWTGSRHPPTPIDSTTETDSTQTTPTTPSTPPTSSTPSTPSTAATSPTPTTEKTTSTVITPTTAATAPAASSSTFPPEPAEVAEAVPTRPPPQQPQPPQTTLPTSTPSALPLHLQYLLGNAPQNPEQVLHLQDLQPPRHWLSQLPSQPPPPATSGALLAVGEALLARHAAPPPPPPASDAGLLDILSLQAFHGQASEPSSSSIPAPMLRPVQYTFDGKPIPNPLFRSSNGGEAGLRLHRRQRRGARVFINKPTGIAAAQAAYRSDAGGRAIVSRRPNHPFSGMYESFAAAHGRHIVINPMTWQIECSAAVGWSRTVAFAHYKCRPGSRRDTIGECHHEGPTWTDYHPAQCPFGMRHNVLTGKCRPAV